MSGKIVFYNIQMKAATKGLMIWLKSEKIEDMLGDNYKLQYNIFWISQIHFSLINEDS